VYVLFTVPYSGLVAEGVLVSVLAFETSALLTVPWSDLLPARSVACLTPVSVEPGLLAPETTEEDPSGVLLATSVPVPLET
jgi:hypothetical protein